MVLFRTVPGIGKFHDLSKMCNRYGNSRLMSDADKLHDIGTGVRSIMYMYTCVCLNIFEQCTIQIRENPIDNLK